MRLPVQIGLIVFRKKDDSYKFLLLKRTKERGGFWQPISGGLESEENVEECLIRELEEEAGISKIKRKFYLEHLAQFEDENGFREGKTWMSEFTFGIEVEPEIEVNIKNNPVYEHDQYKWVLYEEAMRLFKWDNNKQALMKLKNILEKEN